MGVQVFSNVQFLETHDNHGNFRTFFRAMVTLVRSMTGEAWNEIMHDLKWGPDYFGPIAERPCLSDFAVDNQEVFDKLKEKCLHNNPLQCGNPFMSYFLFISCTLIVTFIVLNLVVAVILEGFEDSTANHEEEIVNLAIDNWKKYDPDYTLQLPIDQAQLFIDEIEDMVIDTKEEKLLAKSIVLSEEEMGFLSLQATSECGQKIHFVAVVQACLRQVMLKCIPDESDRAKLIGDIASLEAGKLDHVVKVADPNLMMRSSTVSSPNARGSSPETTPRKNNGSPCKRGDAVEDPPVFG